MDRNLWMRRVYHKQCPPWPCPTCGRGTASLTLKSLKSFETAVSKLDHNHPEFDVEWIRTTFTAHATCSNPKCKEHFVLAGNGRVAYEVTSVDEDGQPDYELTEVFEPLVCEPMPDIIHFPPKCPKEVVEELRSSFRLFWMNSNSSAGRIRCALEKLMDYLKIPTTRTNSKGKVVGLDLHHRIEIFSTQDSIQGGLLMALKIVGNTGSHHDSVTKTDVLDALEILEHALAEIVENRSARIAKLASQLTAKHKK